MSNLVTVEKLEPLYTGIRHGKMNAYIYLTAKYGKPRYKADFFRWVKESSRSSIKKQYLYDHEDDFHDVARCLENADKWIVQAKGLEIPPEPTEKAQAPSPDDEVGFSAVEILGLLHQAVVLREFDKESEALREFEKDIRAGLDEFSSEEKNRAIAKYKGSEVHQAIEAVRKRLTPYQKAS